MAFELVGLLGIAVMLLLIALRVPVAIAMIVVAVCGYSFIVTPDAALARLGADAFRGASMYSLSVIPFFIFMGMLLANAGLGRDAYLSLDRFLWRVKGGLAVATIGASTMFAAVSGSSVASASTMSRVAVPQMRRHGYDDGLSAASAAVGGTLGALIPPSALLVLYGVLTQEPIGQVLIAGFVPGVLTAMLLMTTAYLLVRRRPGLAPANTERPGVTVIGAIRRVWPVPVIFAISMGGLYFGFFTPTESGVAGAFLALMYGLLTRRLNRSALGASVNETITVTAQIFLLMIAGQMFGFFLAVTRIPMWLGQTVGEIDLTPWLIVGIIFLIYLALGAIMDEIAILVIMTPMMYPIIIDLGYDGVWFGVVTIMMLLTGLLTPPIGLITFVVSGLTGISLGKVFRGLVPFWLTLCVAIAVVIAFPALATWLPSAMR
ncbi:TRAP transporter large permease [Phytoactinopolyspora mesophila]|uniref:TRAP transporter large permease subunit n=1 Tax=Phytoactinopolyspora mesophila TaxID=2650750 RepID=A0A7K3LZD7_9ACTN|nr:TRAP transporter large permease [Phytoactinopolyspora mesophila]NDL55578.1 TRAP transporter large permease subunit [Phytoactinopolyspora mesophila]